MIIIDCLNCSLLYGYFQTVPPNQKVFPTPLLSLFPGSPHVQTNPKLQVIESWAGPENKVNYVMITLNAYEGEAVSHLVKD